ncbi:hypothetical protein J437_LFUL014809 [Ladona fulva]|uniref:Endonuclease-reverse transcriptase n=1 Tax=Ladona fulva TaxID=123851 RepID=A0A8K0PAC5_LADFU|nr:hypothetical protein J437_LFUL014809 [Ladona fulva]
MNNTSEEILRRIILANRCYYGLHKQLKAQTINTWVMNKNGERILEAFEWKILRKIYGPINDQGLWHRRYNFELYRLFSEPDIVKNINISSMGWVGHVIRMGNDQIPKRLTMGKPDDTRSRGRPKKRWLGSVNTDMNAIGVRNWREVAIRREEGQKTLQRAKTHTGL